MALEDLRICQDATSLSIEVTEIVYQWSHFDQHVLGEQFCRSVDSISSNISEGYGRSSPGEKLQFLFYAEGSLQEAKHQLTLGVKRKLISAEKEADFRFRFRRLSISIIEFCASFLEHNPSYKGQFRDHVARRRAWLLCYYEQKNPMK